MTFSQEVKGEVLKSLKNIKGCCATSFLTAVLKSIGSLRLKFRRFSFTVESDNHDFLTMCKKLSQTYFNSKATIESSNVNAKGVAVYSCSFEGNIGDKLGLIVHDEDGLKLCDNLDELIPVDVCCKCAFLQGLFLSAGSVVIPVADTDTGENKLNTKYHLELRFADGAFADAVSSVFAELDFRRLQRKNHIVLYQKDSERIADFLVYVGATRGKLQLENVKIGRSLRNNANRQRNCSIANIDKALAAAEKQLEAIETLKRVGQYNNLPAPLREIADARADNPEATLEEIAAMLKISKSGANHRFTRIIELSNSQEIK